MASICSTPTAMSPSCRPFWLWAPDSYERPPDRPARTQHRIGRVVLAGRAVAGELVQLDEDAQARHQPPAADKTAAAWPGLGDWMAPAR